MGLFLNETRIIAVNEKPSQPPIRRRLDGGRKWTFCASPVGYATIFVSRFATQTCRNSIRTTRLQEEEATTEPSLPSINFKKHKTRAGDVVWGLSVSCRRLFDELNTTTEWQNTMSEFATIDTERCFCVFFTTFSLSGSKNPLRGSNQGPHYCEGTTLTTTYIHLNLRHTLKNSP